MRIANFDIGLDKPLFLIAGTCSIESLEMSIEVAGTLKEITSS
jgi:2-dehydro-3-deoxyphosphooctonate aldolase (KDO 8-P synthase)